MTRYIAIRLNLLKPALRTAKRHQRSLGGTMLVSLELAGRLRGKNVCAACLAVIHSQPRTTRWRECELSTRYPLLRLISLRQVENILEREKCAA